MLSLSSALSFIIHMKQAQTQTVMPLTREKALCDVTKCAEKEPKIGAYRCRRLGSWKILAGMVDRRLRLSRRTCRLLDRLAKQPLSSAEMRLLLRNLRGRGRSEGFERGCK